MKQFFSYLGASLAAIAALVSCNKEIDAPVEDLKGGVPFEICASTADTKTAIDGEFKTTWVVGATPDSINVYHKLASAAEYTHDGKVAVRYGFLVMPDGEISVDGIYDGDVGSLTEYRFNNLTTAKLLRKAGKKK